MTRKRRGRGEGSIFQREDGLWVASASLGYDANGKRIRKTAYGKTKREAQEKLNRLLIGSAPADVDKLTVTQYIDLWLEAKKRTVAPTTHRSYSDLSRMYIKPHVGHYKLTALRPLHVNQMYAALVKTGETVSNQRKAGGVLFSVMRQAAKIRLIEYNPCADLDRPRTEKREMSILTPGQVDTFLKAAKEDPLHPLYVLALTSGMRSGELFALYWKDIDFEGRAVSVVRTLEELSGKLRLKPPKSARGTRRIDLPKMMMDALHDHRKRALAAGRLEAPVFCDSQGGWLRRSNVARQSFYPILKRAELPRIRFHDLRHTAATLLLIQGVHPKVVSERLGHASVEITLNTYSHVLPTLQRDAAEKLDQLLG